MQPVAIFWANAWYHRSGFKKVVREVCALDPEKPSDREKIKQHLLRSHERYGVTLSGMHQKIWELHLMEFKWGFDYWAKRMRKGLVREGIMVPEKFDAIAEEAAYPYILEWFEKW